MITSYLFVNCLKVTCLLTFCCLLVAAQQPTLTNDDIIKLVKLNISETIVIAKIKNSKCECDTSSTAIIKLKENQVSDALIIAMMEANQKIVEVTKKSESLNEEAKVSESKIIISPRSTFVSATASDLDSYPEKYEGKAVYLRAKVSDVVREEKEIFSVGLSTGSVSYRNDYKYFPPILGRSGVNFIASDGIVEALLQNKKYDLEATIGGLVSKIGGSNSRSWAFYIFNINAVTSNSTLLSTAFLAQTEIGFMNVYFLEAFTRQNVDVNIKNKDERTPLILSVTTQNKPVLKGLIKLKVNLDEVDKDGKTALMYAVDSNVEDFVKELIKAGANANVKDKTGKTAVDYATNGDKNILKLFKKD